MKSIPGTLQEGGAGFQTTHWTVVLHAQQTQSEVSAQKALSNFCEAYWPPLYAFLRHRGHASPESGLAAIRDSRIAFYQMSFGPHPRHTRYRKSAGEELSARLRAWREKNDFSQSEAALRLQISKRTLQEWEQERAEPRGLASAAIEKTIRR